MCSTSQQRQTFLSLRQEDIWDRRRRLQPASMSRCSCCRQGRGERVLPFRTQAALAVPSHAERKRWPVPSSSLLSASSAALPRSDADRLAISAGCITLSTKGRCSCPAGMSSLWLARASWCRCRATSTHGTRGCARLQAGRASSLALCDAGIFAACAAARPEAALPRRPAFATMQHFMTLLAFSSAASTAATTGSNGLCLNMRACPRVANTSSMCHAQYQALFASDATAFISTL